MPAQVQIIRLSTDALVDFHQVAYHIWGHRAQPVLRRLLFRRKRTVDADLSPSIINDDMIRVRDQVWSRHAIAGGEDASTIFLILSGRLEELIRCHSPVGFSTYQKVQKTLRRTDVAGGCGEAELADDRVYERNSLDRLAVTDVNETVSFLNRYALHQIIDSAVVVATAEARLF